LIDGPTFIVDLLNPVSGREHRIDVEERAKPQDHRPLLGVKVAGSSGR